MFVSRHKFIFYYFLFLVQKKKNGREREREWEMTSQHLIPFLSFIFPIILRHLSNEPIFVDPQKEKVCAICCGFNTPPSISHICHAIPQKSSAGPQFRQPHTHVEMLFFPRNELFLKLQEWILPSQRDGESSGGMSDRWRWTTLLDQHLRMQSRHRQMNTSLVSRFRISFRITIAVLDI